jgi:hypothetical protein
MGPRGAASTRCRRRGHAPAPKVGLSPSPAPPESKTGQPQHHPRRWRRARALP